MYKKNCRKKDFQRNLNPNLPSKPIKTSTEAVADHTYIVPNMQTLSERQLKNAYSLTIIFL